MGNPGLFLDAPSIPVILERLMESEGGRTEDALMEDVADRVYLDKAIDILLKNGLIERDKGLLRLARGKRHAQSVLKIVDFYRQIGKMRRRNLVFRGILNSTQYRCLIHRGTFFEMMAEEGFQYPDVEGLLHAETKQGYVEQMKIVYRASRGAPHKLFPFIPLYYYPHFLVMTTENTGSFKAKLENAGILLIEEEYLLGNYPKDIALQAREYMLKEKDYIRERIKSEAFDIWWYYRF